MKLGLPKTLGLLLVPALLLSACDGISPTGSDEAVAAPDGAFLGQGNGAPNGWHATLNLIGIDKDDRNMPDNLAGGSVIFVKLGSAGVTKRTKILLSPGDDFLVLDKDGTDGEASFQLPIDVSSTYSVYARALGGPGGKVTITTCGEDPTTGDEFCSLDNYMTMRTVGKGNKPRFENVSSYLFELTILVDPDDNPDLAACLGLTDTLDVDDPAVEVDVNLFDPCLENYFWAYDNNGLRLLQLRFYPEA